MKRIIRCLVINGSSIFLTGFFATLGIKTALSMFKKKDIVEGELILCTEINEEPKKNKKEKKTK